MNYTLHSGSISTFHFFYSTELLGKDRLKPLSLCLYNFLDISSSSTNKTVIENVCYTTGAVIGCLARETTNQLPMYLSLVKRITSHLDHFMELACSEGKVTNMQKKNQLWHVMSRDARKLVFVVSDQVQYKLACTVIEAG